MAWVWNVMLSFSSDEFWELNEDEPRDTCQPLEEINRWITHGRLVNITGPTHEKGAGNGMDANLYGGGFKHFDIEAFINVVTHQNWKNCRKVQLWVKGGEEGMSDEEFTLVKLIRPRKKKVIKKTPRK
jgi:hypothetical protein